MYGMYEMDSFKQVVKIKSNAGKHIGVSPSVFYMSPGEVRELSGFRFLEEWVLVTVKPANVDALIIEKATMNKENKGCVWYGSSIHRFKLQFNTLEISAIFYDKIRTVSERDFLDIINKRVIASALSSRLVEHVEEGKDQAEHSSRIPCLYPTLSQCVLLIPTFFHGPAYHAFFVDSCSIGIRALWIDTHRWIGRWEFLLRSSSLDA